MRDEAGERLTPELVLELQRILTEGTLDDPDAAGRLQQPGGGACRGGRRRRRRRSCTCRRRPRSCPQRLQALCDFANEPERRRARSSTRSFGRSCCTSGSPTTIRSWTATGGRRARSSTGTCARAGYWLIEYLSISRILREAPAQVQHARSSTRRRTTATRPTSCSISCEVIERAVHELHDYLQRKVARGARGRSCCSPTRRASTAASSRCSATRCVIRTALTRSAPMRCDAPRHARDGADRHRRCWCSVVCCERIRRGQGYRLHRSRRSRQAAARRGARLGSPRGTTSGGTRDTGDAGREGGGDRVRVHEYAHDPAADSYALEAAEALGARPGARVQDARRARRRTRLTVCVVPSAEHARPARGRQARGDGADGARRARDRLRRGRDQPARPAPRAADARRRLRARARRPCSSAPVAAGSSWSWRRTTSSRSRARRCAACGRR